MILNRRKVRIETERMSLRPPVHGDHRAWSDLRRDSADFLTRWEPSWAPDHLSRRAFTNRVYWAQRSINNGSALPLFLIRREDEALLGAITLDNIRRGPAQAGTIGYWTGERYAREGYMREASRGVLERAGFKYEGVAQSYLQIDGRWRTHVLYAALRMDRRGRTDVG